MEYIIGTESGLSSSSIIRFSFQKASHGNLTSFLTRKVFTVFSITTALRQKGQIIMTSAFVELSQTNQVLVFTCHRTIADMFANVGGAVVDISQQGTT